MGSERLYKLNGYAMMPRNQDHIKTVAQLQQQMRELLGKRKSDGDSKCISLQYGKASSFTMRTKLYKKNNPVIDCGPLNRVIEVDSKRRVALVEPRVTMEQLLLATLPYGLTPVVVPEFKGITVGGAIMGMAGESGSHKKGCFNDTCLSFEILCGDGSLLRVSAEENSDVFYGVPGSYGSLGALMSAEIQLVPAKDFVLLKYHAFYSPEEAIEKMKELSYREGCADFVDGIIFSKNLAVVIEGSLQVKEDSCPEISKFSLKSVSSKYYYQHVKQIALDSPSTVFEERMGHHDYFFRYDPCAFWMGSYLFRLPIFKQFASWWLFKSRKAASQGFYEVANPGLFKRVMAFPIMSSKFLSKLLHESESWVQKKFIIQDFSIPYERTAQFLRTVLDEPGVFPIWLLPIKGTNQPQIFAPHLNRDNGEDGQWLNFGIYGIPRPSGSLKQITKKLEKTTHEYGGRKTLYSHSYYTQDEFWKIYSLPSYEALREKMHAKAVWTDILKKVLSD